LIKLKSVKINGKIASDVKKEIVTPPVLQTNPVTSYFQSGGITAGQVNFGPVPRSLDANSSGQILLAIPDVNEKIEVQCVMGDSESFQFATQVTDFLKKNGYKNVDGVTQAIYRSPVFGQSIMRDTVALKTTIVIGSKN
jgi:hypothetical protein